MKNGVYTWEPYGADDEETETAYLKYTETLAITNKTEVVIGGNAFVKGSVYGGSENGHVREDTHVMITGGQIGNGHILLKDATTGDILVDQSLNRPYSSQEWINGTLSLGDDDLTDSSADGGKGILQLR